MFAPWQTSALPRPGVGNPVSPAGNSPRSEQGSPKFLGNHNCPFAMVQTDAGRTVYTRPYGATAWPLVIEGQRLPRKVFRRSIALLSDSLSTLRSADYSSTTQDSLPVAGQALLDGLSTRRVPLKGFKVVDYISFPFPKLLGAIDVTEAGYWTSLFSSFFLNHVFMKNTPTSLWWVFLVYPYYFFEF